MRSSTRSTVFRSWPRFRICPSIPITAYMPCRAAQLRALLDPVDRVLGRAPEDREDGDIRRNDIAVVAPFAGRDHPAIEREDRAKFGPVEGDLFGDRACRGEGGG